MKEFLGRGGQVGEVQVPKVGEVETTWQIAHGARWSSVGGPGGFDRRSYQWKLPLPYEAWPAQS